MYRRRSVVRRLGRAGVRPLVDLAGDMKGLAREAWAAAAPPDDESTAEKYPGWVRGWGGKALIVVAIVVVFIGWWLVMGLML
ncbi:hypothetical protein [Nesterenkonia sp. K-15-9-6]|uniref:hypothetical protein n=1 Tax=Nesterenkonia sp. K-15-9-6 TaxID=3093918 RepID=UPI0040444896